METSPALTRADTIFDLQEAFLHAADEILDEIRRLYSGRREKVIERACQIIERQLSHPVTAREITLPAVAASLGVSSGHLCRLFRKSKGVTLERYVMMQRVERAKRLLLDPTNNVSRVAELCGFSDPTYFARVFRMLTGRAPSRYAEAPAEIDESPQRSPNICKNEFMIPASAQPGRIRAE
jgi:AraC-like DNA-binding protein